jgi:hypothetical protein
VGLTSFWKGWNGLDSGKDKTDECISKLREGHERKQVITYL